MSARMKFQTENSAEAFSRPISRGPNLPDQLVLYNFANMHIETPLNDDASVLSEKASAEAVRKSYVYGLSNRGLLFDTIGDRLRMAVDQVPDREFVIFKREGIRATYQKLLHDCEKLATGLLHLGLDRGDRVGIWGPNSYEWIVCQFGSALAGMILVNVNPCYQTEELRFALSKVGIKALISPAGFKKSNYYASMLELMPEISFKPEGRGDVTSHNFPHFCHYIMIDSNDPSKLYSGAWSFTSVLKMGNEDDRLKLANIERRIQPDDPVNIQYTSGTTGQPKGATLTHHNVVNNAFFAGHRTNYADKRVIICCLPPLYHSFGSLVGSLCACVHLQTCVFPAPSFEALASLQTIQEEKCTHIYGTPTMYIDMIMHPSFDEYDYSSLIGGLLGGSPCPAALCHKVIKEFELHDLQIVYGATEISPVCHMSILSEPVNQRMSTVGYILDHVESAVVDKEGMILPIGECGEVLIRGYSVMRGYWGSEEHTKEEITPDRWYHTGDIGMINENGALNIVGRKKDMIVRGGENIYPVEVEDFLLKHPKIVDVQVVGVPDERFGEVVCAWIRLSPNSDNITTDDIRDHCKGKIAHFKIPRYILFKNENEFPITATGKVKKYEIRELSKMELGLHKLQPPSIDHFNGKWIYDVQADKHTIRLRDCNTDAVEPNDLGQSGTN